jgi:uncharacterized membrane protein (UPF0127 family)
VRRASAALLVALVAAACQGGGDGSTTPSSSGATPVVVPEGFGRASVDVTTAEGRVVAWCVWLADEPAARARGLMQVTDLGGLDGMLFRYASPSTDAYYMLRTRLPLSIAFFADGAFVSAADMAPCPDDDDDPACPRYAAGAAYTAALEVPQGALDAAGIGPGARLAVGGTC